MRAPIHRLVLAGCAPTPLSSYLKALGVLRIVAEQADPDARGLWEGERFVLYATLDRPALLEFFLKQWSPSPFVSPWNKGSGLAGRDPKGVDPLLASIAPRFEAWRDGIRQAREVVDAFSQAVKDERTLKGESNRIKDKVARDALRDDPVYKQRLSAAARRCKRLKDQMQPECQRSWRGPALRWLRVAVVIQADGSAVFPSLLGTGGNDGKLDFTNNAMQCLGGLFDLGSAAGEARLGAAEALDAAIFGSTEQALTTGAIGQFAPADSGGANASAGARASSMLNPWDLPLLLEGALLFSAGASRRLGGSASERTVAPFSARPWSAGYASAANADESARGEQWMPLWRRPWTAGEVSALLIEGRCQVGDHPSDSALDLARAISRLGVARGVHAFERYAYIERNGKSNYAVPIGRWQVTASPRASLIDDLDQGQWWSQLRRAARDAHAPASVGRCEQALADAVLDVLSHGAEPGRWQEVLIALAQLEAQLVHSGAFTASRRLQPIPRLSAGWAEAADDGHAELRLALSLASAAAPREEGAPWDPVRGNWLPLGRGGRFATAERGLVNDPRVVMAGRDAEQDLIRLVLRRILDAKAGAGRTLRIAAPARLCARQDDLMALLHGRVDIERTMWLARALAAVDMRTVATPRGANLGNSGALDPAWAALRLCHLPGKHGGDTAIPVDPAIVRLLAAGDASRAFSLVLQRLGSVGIRAPLQAVALDPSIARRFAASLAFPISPTLARHLADRLHPRLAQTAKEPHHAR